jgi:hypothetical protein
VKLLCCTGKEMGVAERLERYVLLLWNEFGYS